ncbi:HAMP domain-containing histidine kinase [Trinickia violacea]|uniref:histidine kinase n=1 Tax=Trinickia violacea TaxID=2571746 RepID=A0A4P8IVV1_9BURK|nr:HAMP domain-containing sensor histidine kinase [Trinickia violacea]QCP53448.1 HAMP domain-containing histidine kinase [Trinickia violacea]
MNTWFARTVLLPVAMLLAAHGGYQFLTPAPSRDDGFALAAGSPRMDARGQDGGQFDLAVAGAPPIKPAIAVKPRIVDLSAPIVRNVLAEAYWPCAFRRTADARLPDDGGLNVSIDARVAALILVAPLALLAVCLWSRRTQRAWRSLARTIRESHACGAWAGFEDAPRDVRRAARTLRDLMCSRKRALEEQSEAMSAFARHIDERVSRLRTRALTVGKWHQRAAFIEEIEAFTAVANQFAGVAAPHATPHSTAHSTHTPLVPVDWFLRDWSLQGGADEPSVVLHLKAGPHFMLPRAALERMIGNLVGNALAHGAPPVEIRTTGSPRAWTLSVRDHGEGIEERDFAAVLQPSAPRDATGDLGEHWGLGLSIVGRLAESCGAKLKLGNHPEGGLWVRIIVPVA